MAEVAPEVPSEVVEHYETTDEGRRLTEGLGRLELLRTQEVLRRHLPDRPARILDVGGATGVHARWLADDGHDVHVVDLVPAHVEKARAQTGSVGRVTAEVGDARRLPGADAGFDVALVMGPLYHLTDRADRLLALGEARRVVRPGGLIFAAAISRFASLFDGLVSGFLFESRFRAIVDRDLAEGQHRNPTDRPDWFTTAYFHHPDELRHEAVDAGLDVIEVVGVEGLAKWLPHLEARFDAEQDRDTILFAARVIEAEPTLLGLSAHLILVARNPS
ncbi:MAG: methyltransferase domain-containing protein [Acidimicrobiales bacterium]|nr:methyltransferase domain-containing protein [Acidimicrobiales bacterium]